MGNWDFLVYFSLLGCVIPSKINANRVEAKEMVPGTVWTKCYNQKMRQKAVDLFFTKRTALSKDVDFFSFFARILRDSKQEDALKLCNEYSITSQDLDLMNHITLGSKLKTRDINILKRALKKNVRNGGEVIRTNRKHC